MPVIVETGAVGVCEAGLPLPHDVVGEGNALHHALQVVLRAQQVEVARVVRHDRHHRLVWNPRTDTITSHRSHCIGDLLESNSPINKTKAYFKTISFYCDNIQ